MIKSRLVVRGGGGSLAEFDQDFPFDEILPVSVNYAVSDVREPDKVQSDSSKTITIPSSPEVNRLFEYIYEINIETQDFNPNRKAKCWYYVNDVLVFYGDLQLLKINKYDSGFKTFAKYECALVGRTSNLFLDIANLYLTDIDFSDLDHTLTYSSGLFNPTLGSGIVYPFIDYGMTIPNAYVSVKGVDWNFEYLKPAIFRNEYIHRIIEGAGYTVNSAFLNSTYAKSIIIPDCNEGALRIDKTLLDAETAYVGINTDTVTGNTSGSHIGSGQWQYGAIDLGTIHFDDESTPYYDTGSNFASNVYTCAIAAKYSLEYSPKIKVDVSFPSGAVNVSGSIIIYNTIQKSTDGGSTWTAIAISTITQNITGSTQYTQIVPTQWVGVNNAGDKLRCRSYIGSNHILTFTNGSNVPVTSGSTSITLTTQVDTSFFVSFDYENNYLVYGNNVVMANTIPPNISQLDFLTSVIKTDNLYIEPSFLNNKEYILEPREDFIQYTNPLDWTGKRDVNEPIQIYPMGELEAKRYHFTYKQDSDYYNNSYQTNYGYTYGRQLVDTLNDFVKEEKKVELCFSPTPTALTAYVVAPRFYKEENKPQAVNIRQLYFGGWVNAASVRLWYNNYSSSLLWTQYPYCGHVDNPYNPTVDLNFGIPDVLYWTLPTQTFTNNNRYNERWSKYITEITDRDSKIVVMKLRLTATDIANYSFRRPVFIEGTKYFVNRINDYDPQEDGLCEVELLKLAPAAAFAPNNNSSFNARSGNSQTGNISTNNSTGNQNYGGGIIIGGDNNYIGSNTNG